MNVANPVDQAMLARIKDRGNGWVFSAADFIDLGSRDAVDKALSRMAAANSVRRLARGLYDVPTHHPIVGLTSPSVDKIVQAVATKSANRVQPTGAYAANLLGLSEQVPAKVVFLTDGRSKHIRIGNLDIALKQTSPRFMTTAGRISGLVIQSLRYLGKTHITDDTMKLLRKRLSPSDRTQLSQDAALAPGWVGDIMRRLAAQN